ncbi:hypothetical protein [Chromobacterium haemolyticum]|uniref:hypothetical protein n=1 Tax=Chromobacterium haemolyticum TaxID=394935 RepID=UPI0015C47929|nr:hypothetical protein [Chromobacterium haemolyticum]
MFHPLRLARHPVTQDWGRGFALPDLAISDIHFIWRKQQESALVDGFIQSVVTD